MMQVSFGLITASSSLMLVSGKFLYLVAGVEMPD